MEDDNHDATSVTLAWRPLGRAICVRNKEADHQQERVAEWTELQVSSLNEEALQTPDSGGVTEVVDGVTGTVTDDVRNEESRMYYLSNYTV